MSIAQTLRRGLDRLSRRDLGTTLVRGAGTAFLITGIGQALGAVVQVFLARITTKEVYGTFTWVSAWVPTVAIFIALGLPQTCLRFIAEYSGLGDWARCRGVAARSQMLVLSTGIGFAAVGSIALLAIERHRPIEYLAAYLIGLWIVPVATQSALLTQMCRAMRRVVLAFGPMRILQPALMLALVGMIYEARRHVGVVPLMAAAWLAAFACTAFQFFIFRHDLGSRAGAGPPRYETRKWLRVAFPLMLTGGFQMVFSQVDVLTVGSLLGPVSVAIYGAANRTVSLIDFFLAAANVALGPEAAALYAEGKIALLQKAVTTTVRMAFWPAFAATVLLLALGHWLLMIFGRGYAAGYHVLCVLALGCLVSSGAGPVALLLNMTGFERMSARVLGVCAALDIALNILLTHLFGYIGAAYASAFTMALWNIWLAVLVRRYLGIHSFIGFAR